jgi:hypothetical protein
MHRQTSILTRWKTQIMFLAMPVVVIGGSGIGTVMWLEKRAPHPVFSTVCNRWAYNMARSVGGPRTKSGFIHGILFTARLRYSTSAVTTWGVSTRSRVF